MVYSVANRLNYIGNRVKQVRGEIGKYTRGTEKLGASVFLMLTPGHTDVQDLIPQTIVIAIRYVDFIITADELNLPGFGRTLPLAGDLIEWQGATYTVTAPTAADDVYNFTTMYRDRLRVHTVLTTNAPAPTA